MNKILLLSLFFIFGCETMNTLPRKEVAPTKPVVTNNSTLPNTFTTENILKVQSGMSSNEVLKLFGAPKSVRQDICGSASGNPWECVTWKYGDILYDEATFTFSRKSKDVMILNNFDINRK